MSKKFIYPFLLVVIFSSGCNSSTEKDASMDKPIPIILLNIGKRCVISINGSLRWSLLIKLRMRLDNLQ